MILLHNDLIFISFLYIYIYIFITLSKHVKSTYFANDNNNISSSNSHAKSIVQEKKTFKKYTHLNRFNAMLLYFHFYNKIFFISIYFLHIIGKMLLKRTVYIISNFVTKGFKIQVVFGDIHSDQRLQRLQSSLRPRCQLDITFIINA